MSQNPRLAYVVLAAGSSQRFGKCKQLATIDYKKTILEHALDSASEVSPGEIFLVLGAYREEIEQKLQLEKRFPRARIVYNDRWQEGVASSITCAIHQVLHDTFDGAMIMLADQVAVKPEQLKDLRSTWYQQANKIVCAQYSDTLGAPAIFPQTYFDRLLGLLGDKGAKWLINQEKNHVVPFPLPEAKWDIDTERQLNDWQLDTL